MNAARGFRLFVFAVLTTTVGCGKPWHGFDWMFPQAGRTEESAEEELLSEMRGRESEITPTGVSDRSRDIESRLGVR